MTSLKRLALCAALILPFGLAACGDSNKTYKSSSYKSQKTTYNTKGHRSGPSDKKGYSPYGGTDEATRISVGKSYKIKGKRYHPKYQPNYKETGVASWYGPGFHGRKTANGERYDQNEMTAAHKTLPLPSVVRVTRTDTGESIIVRVNDRGPFAHGRIIDLSKAGAKKLDMMKSGVARVKVEYLPEATERYMAQRNIKQPKWWRKVKAHKARQFAAKKKLVNSSFSTSTAQNASLSSAMAPKYQAPQQGQALISNNDREFEQVLSGLNLGNKDVETVPANNAPSFAINFNDAPVASGIAPALNAAADPKARSTGMKPYAANAPTPPEYVVQTAAFSSFDRAQQHASSISSIATPSVSERWVDGKKLYRVVLGPVYDIHSANQLLGRAQGQGFATARILVEK